MVSFQEEVNIIIVYALGRGVCIRDCIGAAGRGQKFVYVTLIPGLLVYFINNIRYINFSYDT